MTSETTRLVIAGRARRRRADWLKERSLAMLAQSVSGKKRTAFSKATIQGVASGIRARRPLAALSWVGSKTDAERVPVALSLLAIASCLIESMSESLAVVRRANSDELAGRSGARCDNRLNSEDVALTAAVTYLTWVGPVADRCLDLVVDQMLDVPRSARETDSYKIVTFRKQAIEAVANCFIQLAQPGRLARDARAPRVLSKVQAGRMIASTILEAASLEIDASLQCARFAPENLRRALYFTLKKSGTEQAVRKAHTLAVDILNELDTALYATAPKIWAQAKHATSPDNGRDTAHQ